MNWNLVGTVTPSDVGLSQYELSWMQMPTAYEIGHSSFRVYFASRHGEKPQICSVDLTLDDNANQIVQVSNVRAGLLKPGTRTWDVDGVYPSSLFTLPSGQKILYTIGWVTGAVDPIFISRIGAAYIDKNGFVEQYLELPVLDLTKVEPFLVSSPTVRMNGLGYEMLYVSGESWTATKSGPRSEYTIRRALSLDPFNWSERNLPAVSKPIVIDHLARPAFMHDQSDKILMSFTSQDDPNYSLNAGLRVKGAEYPWVFAPPFELSSEAGEKARAYPNVVLTKSARILFVNGADRGKQGFSIFNLGDE